MIYREFPSSNRRPALTLLELAVVLVILVALAGIVVPLLPNMLGRAETSSGATNQSEIIKWVQTFEQTHSGYPRDWDALTDGSAKVGYVRGGGDLILDAGLTAGEANALLAVGVNRLQKMVDGPIGIGTPPNHKTFDPYTDPDFITNGVIPTAATRLVSLTLTGQRKLNLLMDGTTTGGKFVVFGFGKRTNLVGKVVASAPVVFREDGTKSPDQVYSRYGVVFQVSNPAGLALERARFVGTCNFKEDGIYTVDDDLEDYYKLKSNGL